jgi:peptidoglycan hydrolase-like protein with peptidoglycan-binding domain
VSRRLLPLAAAVALVAAAPAAAAPVPAPAPSGAAAQALAPAPGAMRLAVRGAYIYHHGNISLRNDRIEIVGTVRPYVPGQVVTIDVTRNGHRIRRLHRTITSSHGRGTFSLSMRATRTGRLRFIATHGQTTRLSRLRARALTDVIQPSAGGGASGLRVAFLQERLFELGYYVNRTGRYDDATGRAVMAFRSYNGLGERPQAKPPVYARLARKKGGFRVRYPGAGRHVEADLSAQVLALISGGKVYKAFHMSSGKPSTPTVVGTFHFYNQELGTNDHGMVNSSYFLRGYAIHGYYTIPNHAASHGCLRVPTAQSRFIHDWIHIGMRIDVYHRSLRART